MTSRSLQASSHFLQAPFVTGAPGPPPLRPPAYLIKEEDDEEMFYSASGRGEPDDLGDLMQEMREGAAWVEGLTMDCELQLPGSGSAPFMSPSATQLPPSCLGASPEEPSGTTGAAGHDSFQAMMSLGLPEKQPRAQREHSAAAQPPLQPSVAAKLMHPDTARGNDGGKSAQLAQSAHMIPVAVSGMGCEGESDPQPLPPLPGGTPGLGAQGGPEALGPAAGGWMAPPLPFYCGGRAASPPPAGLAAGAPAAAARHAGAFYGQLTGQPGTSSSLAGFQTTPPTFYPQQPPATHLMQPEAGGYDVAQLLAGVHPQGGFQPSLMPVPIAQPNSSGDGSDSTKLRLRSSGDGSGNESGGGGCAKGSTRGAGCDPAGLDTPRSCGAALGAVGSSFCDAPSESSDVEDAGGTMSREHSQPQVVPDLALLPGAPFGQQAFAACGMMMPAMHPGGCLPEGAGFGGFPPMPMPGGFYVSPAAQTARLARQRSLQRFREKKARRGFGKKIRYQARKANADKRPRVKGRFVKAGEAAGILAAAAAAASGPELDAVLPRAPSTTSADTQA